VGGVKFLQLPFCDFCWGGIDSACKGGYQKNLRTTDLAIPERHCNSRLLLHTLLYTASKRCCRSMVSSLCDKKFMTRQNIYDAAKIMKQNAREKEKTWW